MKIFTKTALACALAAGAVMASAETVEIRGASGELLVTYSSNSVVVEGGVITLNNGVYVNGYIPGIIPGTEGYACGEDTTADEINGVCIGVGGGSDVTCGTGTELNQAEDQCVPAIPPTLGITSSPTSMADGVTSSVLTFQFSRPVTGFTQSDVSVSPSGHSLSNFSQVNDSRWTARLNRSGNTAGTVTVSVNAGSYQGTNGVSGGAGTRSITLHAEPVNIGDCTIPNNVRLSTTPAVTTFGQAGSSITFKVLRSPLILSHPFTTTSNPDVSGNIDLAGMSYTSDHVKRMWISDCAGGPAISSRCDQSGITSTIKWAQRNIRATCVLDTNTTYFFNIAYPENATFCNSTSGCDALIHHK